jgi:hypothetical protein
LRDVPRQFAETLARMVNSTDGEIFIAVLDAKLKIDSYDAINPQHVRNEGYVRRSGISGVHRSRQKERLISRGGGNLMALPAEVLATLPEDIRGSEHIASYNDIGSIVKDLIGSKTADWKSGLPDDLKTEKSLEGFKAIGDLAKGFVETKKLVGQTLRAPAADAPDEEWVKYYKAGGMPNAPEEYKFSLPDDFKLTKEEEKEVRGMAYRMRLNDKQTQMMIDLQAQGVADMRKAEREELAKTDKAYRDKWGANYERNKAIVSRTLDRIDPEKKIRAFFDEVGVGNNEVMIDHYARVEAASSRTGSCRATCRDIGREEAQTKIKETYSEAGIHQGQAGDRCSRSEKKLQTGLRLNGKTDLPGPSRSRSSSRPGSRLLPGR